MKTKIDLLRSLLLPLLLCAAACSDDDGPDPDPAGTVTLNMFDSSNGRTLLEETEVYINDAGNFSSFDTNYRIADLGAVPSIGSISEPTFGNLVREIAVIAGHGYLIIRENDVHLFPSGVYAARAGSSYRLVRVESLLYKEEKAIGAVVKHLSATPERHGLPAEDTCLGRIDRYGGSIIVDDIDFSTVEEFECAAPLQCQYYDGPDVYPQLVITLDAPQAVPTGHYPIYLRAGQSYTYAYVQVD